METTEYVSLGLVWLAVLGLLYLGGMIGGTSW